MMVLQFAAGLAFLIVGAEALVRGASRLAAAFHIPPLIIGLTVVAFGTSSPELAVSLKSALSGQADVAVGNVVGSNIFNVLFILGLSALITPLVVAQQLVRLEVPLMILLSFGILILGVDGTLSRMEGAFLFILLIAYISFLIFRKKRESREVEIEYENEYGPVREGSIRTHLLNLTLVIIGLGLLVAGSRWLVEGAVSFAGSLGVSELVIGLTIVAAGTSLPEVVTSIIAAMRGERDIAVGNVIGSNLFNIMAVLGLSGLAAPDGISVPDAAIGFDIPVMIAVAIACLPIFFTGYVIARWEGAVFLAYYLAYTTYLVLNAGAHEALPVFSAVMLWFALPLTVLTLLIIAARAYRARSGANSYPP